MNLRTKCRIWCRLETALLKSDEFAISGTCKPKLNESLNMNVHSGGASLANDGDRRMGQGKVATNQRAKLHQRHCISFFIFYRAFVVKMWWFCVTSQSNRYTDRENSILFSAYLSFQSISNLFFTFYIKLLAILWDAVSSVFERILVNLIPLFIDRLIEHKQLFDSMRISRFYILHKIRSAKFNIHVYIFVNVIINKQQNV